VVAGWELGQQMLGFTSTVCPGRTKSSPPARRTAVRVAAVMLAPRATPTTAPAAAMDGPAGRAEPEGSRSSEPGPA
jgi:hypothetical protein